MSDKEKEELEGMEEAQDRVGEIVDTVWGLVRSEFGDSLTEEDMMDLFAALGVVIGMGMNEAFYHEKTLPYELQGILSDFTYRTIYSARYGINMAELEESFSKPH